MLFITRGLPGCGKSTFAKSWVNEHPEKRVRVNLDMLRETIQPGRTEKGKIPAERPLIKARNEMIKSFLKQGLDVIVDDTNLRSRYVRDLRKLTQLVGTEFEVKDMSHISIETCIWNDYSRDDKDPVGEAVIRDMHNRFIRGKPYPLPIADDPEDAVIVPYENAWDDPLLGDCVIVDIDGTVAQMHNRGPFEWEKVSQDLPNSSVIEVVEQLAKDPFYSIIFMSGRDGSCYKATEEWIKCNLVLPHGFQLHMRGAGDMRKDSVVKSELFDRHIRDKYYVVGVFDDRDQVVKMWREMGLTVFQVAEGNF